MHIVKSGISLRKTTCIEVLFFKNHLSTGLRPLAPTKHKKLLSHFTITKYEECSSLNVLWRGNPRNGHVPPMPTSFMNRTASSKNGHGPVLPDA